MLGLGALQAISALGGLAAHAVVGAPPAGTQMGPPTWLFEHYGQLAGAQVALGIANATLGLGVLRRARRAQWVAQLAMAAQALMFVLFGIWMASWIQPGGQATALVFRMVWGVLAIGAGISFGIPLAGAAWLLRQEAVRVWFKDK